MTLECEVLRSWARETDGSALAELAGHQNPMTVVRNLYGPLAEARRQAPVHSAGQPELAGIDDFRVIPQFADRPIFSTLSYETTAEVLGDGARFSSSIWDMTIGQVWGHTIIGMDDPEHRRYRNLISRAFTPRAVNHGPVHGQPAFRSAG
jgi:cytochrome P450